MAEILSLAEGIKKALPHWNPNLHPRDRNGQFIEVGGYVRAFDGPGGPQIAIGKVNAAHYDHATKRLFIGVDVGNGETKWFRPKQLEDVPVKASLNADTTDQPTLPIPVVDSMSDHVEWDLVDPAYKSQIDHVDQTNEASAAPLTESKMAVNEQFMKDSGLEAKDAYLDEEPQGTSAKQDPGPTPLLNTFKDDSLIAIPQGKTAKDVLALMRVTFDKKLDSGTAPFSKAEYDQKFDDILNQGSYAEAWPKLNELMVSLKFGGRQRKRYRSALALHYGGHQDMQVVSTDAPSSGKPELQSPDLPSPTPPDAPLAFIPHTAIQAPEDAVKGGKLKPYTEDQIKALGPAKVLGLLKAQFGIQQPDADESHPFYTAFEGMFNPAGDTPQERFDNAMIDQSTIAKMLKLGGRQRARYRAALAVYYGVDLPDPSGKTPAAGKPSAPKAPKPPKASQAAVAAKKAIDYLDSIWGPDGKTPADPNNDGGYGNPVYPRYMLLRNAIQSVADLIDQGKIEEAKQADLEIQKYAPGMASYWDKKQAAQMKKIGKMYGAIFAAHELAGYDPEQYDPTDSSTWPSLMVEKPTQVKVVPLAAANSMVNPSGMTPNQAKTTIQMAISKRMEGKVDLDKLIGLVTDTSYNSSNELIQLTAYADSILRQNQPFPDGARLRFNKADGNWSLITNSGMTSPNWYTVIDNPTPADLQQALHETIINSMIKLWAQTSNDSNPRSLAMQQAAAEEFKTVDHYEWPMDDNLRLKGSDGVRQSWTVLPGLPASDVRKHPGVGQESGGHPRPAAPGSALSQHWDAECRAYPQDPAPSDVLILVESVYREAVRYHGDRDDRSG